MPSVSSVYINLISKNIAATKDFWTALGFSFNPKFSDDNAVCLVLGSNIYAMLLREEFFKTFTTRSVTDATSTIEVLNSIQVDSRATVDDIAVKAVNAGGKIHRPPQDHGWMYNQSIEDLDGHVWEVLWADESLIPESGP